jgi:uncharacterized protein YdhG (YjbR/CyaY superfamily)
LSVLPNAQEEAVGSLRDTIRSAAECSGTISSGVPAYRYRGRYLVSYGAAKAYLSLFVMRGAGLRGLEEELQRYDTFNTVIRFTPDKPLPTAIVEKMVKILIEEIDAREGD